MIAGIDVGGTNTQGVVLRGGRVVRKAAVEGNTARDAAACFGKLVRGLGTEGLRIVVTGGLSRRLGKGVFGTGFSSVGEIEAIGRGGMFLSGKRDLFIVCMGTGTAFVSVRKGRISHVGGTGLGGGTVMGLSGIMLGKDPGSAERLARGSRYSLDLTVRDIVGSGIGNVPGSATAANFGKASGRPEKSEIAASMFRMVAESVGATSYFAAKSVGQEKDMLVCGRVPLNAIVKKRLLYTIGMFGGKAAVARDSEYCAAIGAALSA